MLSAGAGIAEQNLVEHVTWLENKSSERGTIYEYISDKLNVGG